MRHLVRQGRANTSILQVKCGYHVHLLESGAGKRIQPKIVRNVSQKVVNQRGAFYPDRQKLLSFARLLMPFGIISKPMVQERIRKQGVEGGKTLNTFPLSDLKVFGF